MLEKTCVGVVAQSVEPLDLIQNSDWVVRGFESHRFQ